MRECEAGDFPHRTHAHHGAWFCGGAGDELQQPREFAGGGGERGDFKNIGPSAEGISLPLQQTSHRRRRAEVVIRHHHTHATRARCRHFRCQRDDRAQFHIEQRSEREEFRDEPTTLGEREFADATLRRMAHGEQQWHLDFRRDAAKFRSMIPQRIHTQLHHIHRPRRKAQSRSQPREGMHGGDDIWLIEPNDVELSGARWALLGYVLGLSH